VPEKNLHELLLGKSFYSPLEGAFFLSLALVLEKMKGYK